jgi:acetyltransferase-like isoleucine patch superfamily enzyme
MNLKAPFIHPLADVKSTAIGIGSRIWQFCVVLDGARIGEDCNINAQCLIEGDVVVGDRVTIKPGVQLWDGLRVEDDVFVGPNVTFCNDKYPRSRRPPPEFASTVLRKGASIGANATILCGLEIGAGAMIGAGSVVTKNVPAGELWVGNPAVSWGEAARID